MKVKGRDALCDCGSSDTWEASWLHERALQVGGAHRDCCPFARWGSCCNRRPGHPLTPHTHSSPPCLFSVSIPGVLLPLPQLRFPLVGQGGLGRRGETRAGVSSNSYCLGPDSSDAAPPPASCTSPPHPAGPAPAWLHNACNSRAPQRHMLGRQECFLVAGACQVLGEDSKHSQHSWKLLELVSPCLPAKCLARKAC